MIRFENVTKVYPGGTTAVDDLTVTAPAGEITVLVGPSGCGKTTSLRMVNRMIEPTSGQVHVGERNVAQADPAELRRTIGYVIQHGGLFPHRTILDNVATVPLLLGWDRRRARARAAELLDLVGLDRELATRYPAQLSGGQQQRVGVARALGADPPYMLMDEPFSAVDPIVREQLQDEFLRIQSLVSKTILFVTHDIDEALKLGDKVAVLRVGGRLAQLATPAELLATPADAFVASFIGRDRGYRALGFQSATGLALQDEPTVLVGALPEVARDVASGAQWLLVVDEARMPLGWVEPASLDAPVTAQSLVPGGALAHRDGTLRGALDAALSSPSGRGVVVDDDGAVAGTVSAEAILRHTGISP